jgi:hypothetical protein
MPRMSAANDRQPPSAPDRIAETVGHPRGTLAIVLVFAALFALGWFAMFFSRFMGQGAPHAH